MAVVFYSDFTAPDPRWTTRHVTGGEAATRATEYRNGKVILGIKKAKTGDPIRTSHISTTTSFEFTYGRAEARMRFKAPAGAHSAFWLQTTEDYIPGQAEIDVVEHFGWKTLWHNVYWREPGQKIGEFTSAKESTKLVDPATWHVYAVDWKPDRYDFLIDGTIVATIREGLSDRPKMLILSILSADWERDDLQTDALWKYRTWVDWVTVHQ